MLDYRLDYLADDIVKVIDHFDREKAIVCTPLATRFASSATDGIPQVAGHDWGGAVAWHLATVHEEKLEKLIIINLPHPAVFTEHLRTVKQLYNSWYIFFFQTPWVPEAKIYKCVSTLCRCAHLLTPARRDSFRWLTGVFSMSPPGTFSRELILKYHEAWSQPGAVTGMLNWYRAAIRSMIFLPKPEPKMITVPTLMIWGGTSYSSPFSHCYTLTDGRPGPRAGRWHGGTKHGVVRERRACHAAWRQPLGSARGRRPRQQHHARFRTIG